MDFYKEYLCNIRRLSFQTPYLILGDDVIPKLKHYIRLLISVPFEDGSYHTYYGEIKRIVESFVLHWTVIIDEAIKEADMFIHCINREGLLKLADKTLNLQFAKQRDFVKHFLPVNTPVEKQLYDEIQEKYGEFIASLQKLKDQISRLDKKEKIDDFAQGHFPRAVKFKNRFFDYTNNTISRFLLENRKKVRVSMEEILKRVNYNISIIEQKRSNNLNNLHNQLYAKNKEHLFLSRKIRRPSVDIAEVESTMHVIKDKIEASEEFPMQRLVEERDYWLDLIKAFTRIETTIEKINTEEEKINEQYNLYSSMKDSAIPAPKRTCWENMDKRFQEKIKQIKDLKLKAAKTMLTFFSVRGADRMFYSDNVGPYFVDEYGHQVYFFDYGLSVFHLNCAGSFVQVHESEKDKYYFDEAGRYVVKDGEKLYQVAPCSSTYKMKNDVLVKHTKDCGHSEKPNPACKMEIKDPNDIVKLPQVDSLNFKESLDHETVKYLWDCFGHVLPEAAHDVAMLQSKNPIHTLAHKLLLHRYKRSTKELEGKKTEAASFRAQILKDRKDKAIASFKAWKEKQVKRRKPEESDDTLERSVWDAHADQRQFIMNTFYN